MSRFLFAFLALVAALHGQTSKTRVDLYAQIGAQLASGQQITAAQLRTVLQDVVASAQNIQTDGTAATVTALNAHAAATNNPHAVTKAQIGLGNADNTSDAEKPISTATAAALAGKAAAVHGHSIADTTGLQAALDAKAAAAHGHAIADVSGLQTALDGKSATSHSHAGATTSVAGFLSAADKTKLDGIASGATANSSDAQLRDRATHTGAQAISTVSGLQAALDAKASTASLAAVATSGAYSDLSGRPTLGTAAPLNVAAAGDAAAGEVVRGNDTRLTNSRTPTTHTHAAADIADSTTVGRAVITASTQAAARTAIAAGTSNFDGAYGSLSGLPSTFTPSAHTHTASEVTDYAAAARAQVESMLVAGSNVTLTPSGTGALRQITVAASGGGGGTGVLVVSPGFLNGTNFGNNALIGGSTGYGYGSRVDLTNFTECRLVVMRATGTATTGSKLVLRYNTTFSTSAGSYSDIGTSEVSVAIDVSPGALASGWVSLASGAKADVVVMPIAVGGNAVDDPALGATYFQFR